MAIENPFLQKYKEAEDLFDMYNVNNENEEGVESEQDLASVIEQPTLSDVIPEEGELDTRIASTEAMPTLPPTNMPTEPEKPLSRQEELYKQYLDLTAKGREETAKAREADRRSKMILGIGDALSGVLQNYIVAKSKLPGIKVTPSNLLSKYGSMYDTAKDVSADYKERGSDLLSQYKQAMEEAKLQASRQAKKEEIEAGRRFKEDLLEKQLKVKKEEIEGGRKFKQDLLEKQLKAQKEIAQTKANIKKQELQEKLDRKEQEAIRKEQAAIEKEKLKFDLKAKQEIEKENRAFLKESDQAINDIEAQEKIIQQALDSLDKIQIGTGPNTPDFLIKQDKDGQMFMNALSNLSITKLANTFKGMSKAVDSETEREIFEKSLPSTGYSVDVNKKLLNNLKEALQSLKQKTQNKIKEIKETSSDKEKESASQDVKDEQPQPNSKNVIIRRDPKSGRRVEYDAETKKPIRFLD